MKISLRKFQSFYSARSIRHHEEGIKGKNDPTKHQHLLQSLDVFSFSPNYRYTSYASYFGAVCSFLSMSILILYITVSTKDFFLQPPEIVKQGSSPLPKGIDEVFFVPPPVALVIDYKMPGEKNRTRVDVNNTDPYFRYKFTAKTYREQVKDGEIALNGTTCTWDTIRDALCLKESERKEQKIQGAYSLPLYQYLEIEVLKCDSSSDTRCKSIEEIDTLIKEGEVRVQLQTKEETFDTIKYHNNEIGGYDNSTQTRGVVENTQSWRFFAIPEREQLNEIYMESRSINVEERLIGSPSLQEVTSRIMTFSHMDLSYKNCCRDNTIMSFYIRLHPQTTEEEVQYWIGSLLDLFGYWGAMASFLTVCSFGILARSYNQWKFSSDFRRETRKAMKSSKLTPTQQQPERHMFADLRLFNQEDFDRAGRFIMSREEFYFPSTAYGEVRKIALMEHMQKRNAANKIGTWYSSILIHRKIKSSIVGFNSRLFLFEKKDSNFQGAEQNHHFSSYNNSSNSNNGNNNRKKLSFSIGSPKKNDLYNHTQITNNEPSFLIGNAKDGPYDRTNFPQFSLQFPIVGDIDKKDDLYNDFVSNCV